MIEPLDLSLIFADQHPRDAARVLESLPASKTSEFLANITDSSAARIMSFMAADYAAVCVPLLPVARKILLFKQLEIQTTMDIFRYLGARDKNQLLNQLPLNKRLAVQALNKYSQNSVGAWMSTDYVAVAEDTTVEDVIEVIQRSDSQYQDYVYVIGSRRQYLCAVRVSLLLKASLHARISVVKSDSHDSLMARALIQDTLEHPGWQHHRIMPVTDYDNRLVGILSYRDLNTAVEQSHVEFTAQAANISGSAVNLFWVVFNNFLQLLIDISAIALRKN